MLRDHEIERDDSEQVLVMAASVRTGSINQALDRYIAEELRSDGAAVGVVDLAEFAMPLYDGDLEARDGVPVAARELAEWFGGAEVLVIVSPEYNGAFPPLLKNTIDWATRTDPSVLAHLRVLLASVSPGRGGGAKAVAMTRTWMANIGVAVAEMSLSVGSAELTATGAIANLDPTELSAFVVQTRQTEPTVS